MFLSFSILNPSIVFLKFFHFFLRSRMPVIWGLSNDLFPLRVMHVTEQT